MKLPYAAEADAQLSLAELRVLEQAYLKASQHSSRVPSQIKFNYAWGLVRSRYGNDQLKGIQLFHELLDEDPERHRECVYYLALGYYRSGNYTASRKYNDQLLKDEPDNLQALSLRKLINDKVERDGLIGMAIVGGAVAAVGLLTAAVFGAIGGSRSRRK